jgi:hypothetical protein
MAVVEGSGTMTQGQVYRITKALNIVSGDSFNRPRGAFMEDP